MKNLLPDVIEVLNILIKVIQPYKIDLGIKFNHRYKVESEKDRLIYCELIDIKNPDFFKIIIEDTDIEIKLKISEYNIITSYISFEGYTKEGDIEYGDLDFLKLNIYEALKPVVDKYISILNLFN